MIEVSAHELTRTVLCTVTGCPAEAEPGTDRCREHPVRTAPVARPRPNAKTSVDIVAAIQRWASEHDGAPPKSTDWIRAGDYWPNMTTVVRHFGKWSEAIKVAGFDPGHHQRKFTRAVSEREPEAEVASAFGAPSMTRTVSEVAAATADPPSRSETAAVKQGVLRMLARDVRRVADTLDAFVEAYEADLLAALELEAA